jgi:hypothetical protein
MMDTTSDDESLPLEAVSAYLHVIAQLVRDGCLTITTCEPEALKADDEQ